MPTLVGAWAPTPSSSSSKTSKRNPPIEKQKYMSGTRYQPPYVPSTTHFACRYGQTVKSDDTSTVLAELVNSSGTSAAIINPYQICTQGLSTLSSLVLDAKPGVTMPLKLLVPALQGRVMPCVVDVALAMECPQGYVTQGDARGNLVCIACGANTFENRGECYSCSEGMECNEEGQTLSRVELKPGYWRTDALSFDVKKCRYSTLSCPGVGKRKNTTVDDAGGGRNMYCGPAYVGPLCSQCSGEHFMSWTQQGKCFECTVGKDHAPTIGIASVIFVLGVVMTIGAVQLRRNANNPKMLKLRRLYRLAKMKFFVLFVGAQVLSQFSTVSSSSAGDGSFPEPAATFVRALGLSNLAIPGFVPIRCAASETTFYHEVVLSAALPILGIGALCLWPLSERLIRGRPSSSALGSVKGLSMLLLVVSLPSISTHLVQVGGAPSFGWGG